MADKTIPFDASGERLKLVELPDGTYGVAMVQVGGEISCDTKTVGTTAEAIGGDIPCNEVLIQADPDNAVDVFIGNSTKQLIQLAKGESEAIPAHNINQVYAKAASGTAIVNWMAK